MEDLKNVFDQLYFGVSLGNWLLLIICALFVSVFWGLFNNTLSLDEKEKAEQGLADLKRRAEERRQFGRDIRKVLYRGTLRFSVFVFVVWVGIELQDFPADVKFWSRKFAFVVLMYQVGMWGEALLKYFFDRPENQRLVRGVKILVRTFMWLLVVLVTLENLDVDISTAVAGLGITSVAVALATQKILGDILAFLSITYDQPFEVGDFLVVGEDSGTVEEVTLRSTRLRALSGEALVISNSDLLATRIRNYKTLGERRVLVTIGVVRETPYTMLAEIPAIVSGVIREVESAKLDRVHLRDISESAFDYEVVYYILTPDYLTYMDVRQKINLEVVRRFEDRGIKLALPTRQIRMLDDSFEEAAAPNQT